MIGTDSVTAATDAAVGQEIPDRPPVPQRLRDLTRRWWDTTNDVPEFLRAVVDWRNAFKTQFPQWNDRSDPYRGRQPQETKRRKDDRRVRANIAYRKSQQLHQMLVGEAPTKQWARDRTRLPAPPHVDALIDDFAKTLQQVTSIHEEESHWEQAGSDWVWDTIQFPIGILKVVYDKSFIDDALSGIDEDRDKQGNAQRLRVLGEDFAARRFDREDARFQEMLDLAKALGVESELRTWAGMRYESIPLDSWRCSPEVRQFAHINKAIWQSHDSRRTIEDVRAHYPFQMRENGTWTGVHPKDLETVTKGQAGSTDAAMGDPFWQQQAITGATSGKTDAAKSVADRVLVREVWCRRDNRVRVFIEGVDYPVADYAPARGWSGWYPFHAQVMNTVSGSLYGISDVTLMAEWQSRINRKLTDAEKDRWLSIKRRLFDTGGIDETEVIKIGDIAPGTMRGINMQGKKPEDFIFELSHEHNPVAFDTTSDDRYIDLMSGIPRQLNGVTGDAQYAAEVEAAMRGAGQTAMARGRIVARGYEGVHRHVAEVLIQELTPEDVEEMAPGGVWPKVHSEAEADQMRAAFKAQATKSVQDQIAVAQAQAQAAAAQAMRQGLPAQPVQPPAQHEIDQAIQAEVERLTIEATGFPQIVTRETLFRYLTVSVTVALNAAADRGQRIKDAVGMFDALRSGAMAAKELGMRFDPAPLMRVVGPILGADGMEACFLAPPPMAAAPPPGNGDGKELPAEEANAPA